MGFFLFVQQVEEFFSSFSSSRLLLLFLFSPCSLFLLFFWIFSWEYGQYAGVLFWHDFVCTIVHIWSEISEKVCRIVDKISQVNQTFPGKAIGPSKRIVVVVPFRNAAWVLRFSLRFKQQKSKVCEEFFCFFVGPSDELLLPLIFFIPTSTISVVNFFGNFFWNFLEFFFEFFWNLEMAYTYAYKPKVKAKSEAGYTREVRREEHRRLLAADRNTEEDVWVSSAGPSSRPQPLFKHSYGAVAGRAGSETSFRSKAKTLLSAGDGMTANLTFENISVLSVPKTGKKSRENLTQLLNNGIFLIFFFDERGMARIQILWTLLTFVADCFRLIGGLADLIVEWLFDWLIGRG